MLFSAAERSAFLFYDLCWRLAIPILRRNHRLLDGFDQRTLRAAVNTEADIWIQAASAGEAYLAISLLPTIAVKRPTRVHISTNTRQGLDILTRFIQSSLPPGGLLVVTTGFFPFDRPSLMQKAICRIKPRVLVLMETEIWPGLLAAARKVSIPVVIANGRITKKSYRRYRLVPSLWKSLSPDHILAVTDVDMNRFRKLFPYSRVSRIPNMKFDQITFSTGVPGENNSLGEIVPTNRSVLVLGSIRREEETDVASIVSAIRKSHPDTIIALFPRHMHRVDAWQDILSSRNIPFARRSRVNGPVSNGVLLWDTFGELTAAYALSSTVFVGGTLAKLGGQNFLEPVAYGLSPVIGPNWETFRWVGDDIVRKKIVRVGANWREVTALLQEDLQHLPDRKINAEKGREYIESRQGGTNMAGRLIGNLLI